jgi:hypothetical protein
MLWFVYVYLEGKLVSCFYQQSDNTDIIIKSSNELYALSAVHILKTFVCYCGLPFPSQVLINIYRINTNKLRSSKIIFDKH